MADVDFITALGRLLHDGKLRDEFTSDPVATALRLGLRESDRTAFLQLSPDDLEFQARVLLRKRFDLIRRILPRTCAQLGPQGWSEFLHYGRTATLGTTKPIAEDAVGFCRYLKQAKPETICPVERNRARFVLNSSKFTCQVVGAIPFHKKRYPGIQFFVRSRSDRWHEWLIHFGA